MLPTNRVLYQFTYGSANRLLSVFDAVANQTTIIARDGSGALTTITGPFGHQTTLTLNADGNLWTVANAAGETHQLFYRDRNALLTRYIDPVSREHTFDY